MKNGLAIIFPGTGYTCKQPLLVKCADIYKTYGYDVIKLDFSDIPFSEIETLDMAFEQTKPIILTQLANVQIANYTDIVFISKSFGTICAGWLEEYLRIAPRHLFLTPTKMSLRYLKDTTKIISVVIGTEDKLMDPVSLEEFCKKKSIKCLVLDGVGHGLFSEIDPNRTEAINEQIYALCLGSLGCIK